MSFCRSNAAHSLGWVRLIKEVSLSGYKPSFGLYAPLPFIYPPSSDIRKASISDSNYFSVAAVMLMILPPQSIV